MKSIDLIGLTFGRVRVIETAGHRGVKRLWRCVCSCGCETIAQTSDLTSGKHQSCGCLQRERATRHGATMVNGKLSITYRSWQSMKDRCQNPNATHFERYGGRGIAVCDAWRASFTSFVDDVGERPSRAHTIERVDNDGDYEPGNVRWATRKEQASNRHFNPASVSNTHRNSITGRFSPR